ncbi:hypothetical protein Tco_1126820, partial [Tanacetum coccineum]
LKSVSIWRIQGLGYNRIGLPGYGVLDLVVFVVFGVDSRIWCPVQSEIESGDIAKTIADVRDGTDADKFSKGIRDVEEGSYGTGVGRACDNMRKR